MKVNNLHNTPHISVPAIGFGNFCQKVLREAGYKKMKIPSGRS